MLLIIFLHLVCASSFTISKAVLQYAQPFFFIGVRMSVSGIFLLLFCRFRRESFVINRVDWARFAGVVLIYIYAMYMADLWALQGISSSKSAFIFSVAPFISAIISYFYFAERMTAQKWSGLALGFIGLLPEMYVPAVGELETGGIWFVSSYELIMFISVISSVIGWVIVRDLILSQRYSAGFINGIGMFFGGILALVTSFFIETWWIEIPYTDGWIFTQLTFLIIVTANLLFHNLYTYLLQFYTATFLSFSGFIVPFFVSVLGAIFLHEQVGSYFYISLFFVSIGLYIFYQEDLRQGHIRPIV